MRQRRGVRQRRRFTEVAHTILLILMMMTPVVVSMYWRSSTGSSGLSSTCSRWSASKAPIWTGTVAWAMPTVIVSDAWQWMPFLYLILLAGLQSLPADVMEAARIDGGSGCQRCSRTPCRC